MDGKLILAVDDDPDVLFIVVETLRASGYTVIEASSAPEALDILRGEPRIELIFTDIVMPGEMNGFELAHAAKELRPDLRVIYTSGYSRNHGHQRGPEYGPMLQKPYRNERLISEVARALAS